MSNQEQEQLARLKAIAGEQGSPLTEWERGFVLNLSPAFVLSDKQAAIFDRLVQAHLSDQDE